MLNIYNIEDYNNYKKNMTEKYTIVIYKYLDLINNFLILSFKYFILYKNKNFIVKKGIELIYHIFNLLFLYTYNLELTYYHCDKAINYYIEFNCQINSDNNILSLNNNDAILFVFKKTIFDLINNPKHIIANEDKEIITIIKLICNIYNILMYNIIDNNDNDDNNDDINNFKKKISKNYKIMKFILNDNDKIYKIKTLDNQNIIKINNANEYINKLNLLYLILEISSNKKYEIKFIEEFIKKIFNNNLKLQEFKTIKQNIYNKNIQEHLVNKNINKFINCIIYN